AVVVLRVGHGERREDQQGRQVQEQCGAEALLHRVRSLSTMAVAQASELAKDMAGTPLFRSVSFKLERRERLTLAGRNGAGKTTLLRMLSGETSIDGGQLTF